MRRIRAALAALSLLVGSPALGALIGFDDRNGIDATDRLTGSDFDDLRAIVTGLGHTVVGVSTFDSAALAPLDALYVAQTYTQSGGGFTGAEIAEIHAFVAAGGGLVLHADGGAGFEAASMNSLASVFGVSFAAAPTEANGHEILLFDAHPVTAGLGSLPGTGLCVDFQRVLTIDSPAVDLTTLNAPLVPEDDALAAMTGTGGGGNVVVISDKTAFKDADVNPVFNIECGGNAVLAQNIVNFVAPIPEPGTAALVALGIVVLAARRLRRAGALALGIAALICSVASPNPAHAACTGTAAQCGDGQFGSPFEEPTLLGLDTPERCLQDEEGVTRCKVTAGTLVALPDDRFLYWNALEGTEDVEVSIVAEFGYVSVNDQSRLLTIAPGTDAPTWTRPTPEDGGAVSNPGGIGPCDDGGPVENEGADAALFCSDQKMLHDGRVLAAGGTDYYNDTCVDWNATLPPGIAPFPPGGAELEGIKNARIFDPATNEWTQTDSMEFGRWYPAAVTLPDGDVFIASGVTRLVKPVYPDNPMASGRNVVETETYDTSCGLWSTNPPTADRTLPLFPRMHLLPNGHVYFNAGGQAFNPFGQAYDMVMWNFVASYNPATQTWTDHGVAGVPGIANPLDATSIPGAGFRGSTFSVMLMLEPNALGQYTTARFLTAGGVESNIVNPSPGQLLATTLSRIDTMNLAGPLAVYSSAPTGPLAAPRWYASGTLLPNGQVLTTSGADKDGVKVPGSEISVTVAELFTPGPNTWEQVATQNRERTYHNSAVLMRDGRVLVGGHAPITNSYTYHFTTAPGVTAPNEGRDPSFEIYSPWYVFRDDRPVITAAPASVNHNSSISVTATGAPNGSLHSFVLMRRTASTHLVDGDQRSVKLRVLATNPLNPSQRTLAIPGPNVLPPGKYVLYANVNTSDGVVPSKGVPVTVGASVVGACN